jgi:L-Ala-D/L-Glu epimerase
MRIRSIQCSPLTVPLSEPFVIASGRIDATRAALVELELFDEDTGRSARGLGEAAALPPVTAEDQPELLASIAAATSALCDVPLPPLEHISALLVAELGASPVARAGVECALLDAWARLQGLPVCSWLRGRAPSRLHTDITLSIADPAHMVERAVHWRGLGFVSFKVKVGKRFDDDLRVLLGVHDRIADATFRLDANGGYDATAALELVRHARAAGLVIECFEQPCAREDWDGMARVAREAGVPVIADESLRDDADLTRILDCRAAQGINLKLSKLGGPLRALALGERARAHGLSLMCGGMVETRLGMTAMAHVACALGGVEFIDLDTAFLLAEDRFEGGYTARGAELEVHSDPGFGVTSGCPTGS